MELPIAYMCPYGLDIDISSSFFPHFWQGNSRKSQDLAWAACSVPRKADQAATNSEFCGCKVLVPNAGFLLASMSSYCRFRPIECSYSQSVSVFVHQDKIRGSAIVGNSVALISPPSELPRRHPGGRNSSVEMLSSGQSLAGVGRSTKITRDVGRDTPKPLHRVGRAWLSVGAGQRNGATAGVRGLSSPMGGGSGSPEWPVCLGWHACM